MNEMQDALNELNEYLNDIGSCSDGNCIIVKPKGMHTNGGCKCSRDHIRMQRYAYAMNRFKEKVVKFANF
jgi:hypothetical protein